MASVVCTPASGATTTAEVPDVKYSYHVFISYRVATDGALAEKLCDKLQLQSMPSEVDMRLRCFLDKQSLKLGTEYDDDFLKALNSSCLFIPLVSATALKPLESAQEGVRDNVILEWEVALRLREAGQLDILPLLVGEVSPSGSYSRFNAFDVSRFPAVASGTDNTTTVQETVRRMFRLQGSFLNPNELLDKLPSIVSFLGTQVWPKARARWADQEKLEPERQLTCVQCGAGYVESANGSGSCRFHVRGTYNGSHACCGVACASGVDELKAGQETGCRRARHRPKHHSEYTYVSGIYRVARIMNYTNTHDEWMAAKCEHYAGEDMATSIGVLTCDTGDDAKGCLYVQVDGYVDFFCVFPPAALSALQQELASGGSDVLVSHTRKGDGSTALLTWVMGGEGGKHLRGIRAVLRAATSPPACPSVSELSFRLGMDAPGSTCPPGTPATRVWFEGVRHVSRGGIRERFPLEAEEASYGVCDARWYKGMPIAEAEPVTAPRKGFVMQHAQLGCPLRLKLTSPVTANSSSSLQVDMFEAGLAIVNGQDSNVVVMEVTMSMLTADGQPVVADLTFEQPTSKANSKQGADTGTPASPPFTIPGSGSLHLHANWQIDTPDKHVLGRALWDRAWLARRGPVLFQMTVTTLTGASVTAVLEFSNPKRTLSSPAVEGPKDQASLGQPMVRGGEPGARTLVAAGISLPKLVVTCDSPAMWHRSKVEVERMDLPPPVFPPMGDGDSGDGDAGQRGTGTVVGVDIMGKANANSPVCIAGGDDPAGVVVAKVSCPGRSLELSVASLRALVYESMASELAAGGGSAERAPSAPPAPGSRWRSVDVGLGTVPDGPVQVAISALVDLALLRVYGLRVDMTAEGGQGASVGLVRLPLYGGADPDLQPGTAEDGVALAGGRTGKALPSSSSSSSGDAGGDHTRGSAGERVPSGDPVPPFVPDAGFRDYAAAVQESNEALARWLAEHVVPLPAPPAEYIAPAVAAPGVVAASAACTPTVTAAAPLTEAQLDDVVSKLVGKITDVLERRIPGGVGAAQHEDGAGAQGSSNDWPGAAPSTAVPPAWPSVPGSNGQNERGVTAGVPAGAQFASSSMAPADLVGVDIISAKLEQLEKKLLRHVDDRVAEMLQRLPPPGEAAAGPGGSYGEAGAMHGKQNDKVATCGEDGKVKRSPVCSIQ